MLITCFLRLDVNFDNFDDFDETASGLHAVSSGLMLISF